MSETEYGILSVGRKGRRVVTTKIKKLLSFVMAALMCFALTPMAAFAATNDDTGTITIDNAVVGQTYSVYQVLILESYSPNVVNPGTVNEQDLGAYSYKANPQWETWLKSDEASKYVQFNGSGTNQYVTWVEGASVAEFAKLAIAQTTDKTRAADPITATSTTVVFTPLNLGYYLVDSSVGTLCALTTTNPDANITEKNDAPTVTKQVYENQAGAYGQENDTTIGDTVQFQATINCQPGAANYVFHDKMSAGLTYQKVESIKYNDNILESAGNYTINAGSLADECDFEIVFTPEFCAALGENDTIVINYTALLNDEAVVGQPGNDNKASLSYGDGPEPVYTPITPDTETTTYTWGFSIFKYTGELDEDGNPVEGITTALPGAVFELSLFEGIENNVDQYKLINTLTTDENGNVSIKGLDHGTYKLEETVAPDGYNKLAGPITLVITDAGVISATGADGKDFAVGADNLIKVQNVSGSLLPSTGGVGTVVLYVVGAAIVLIAIVALVRRRSKSSK